jgi:hypothetical protein
MSDLCAQDTHGKKAHCISASNVTVYREWYAEASDGSSGEYVSSVLLPMDDSCDNGCRKTLTVPAADWAPKPPLEQTAQSVYVDVWIPVGTVPVTYTGALTVVSLNPPVTATLVVSVRVDDVVMPQQVSWRQDMNGYGDESGDMQRVCGKNASLAECFAFHHRLTHAHRLTSDVVPYVTRHCFAFLFVARSVLA